MNTKIGIRNKKIRILYFLSIILIVIFLSFFIVSYYTFNNTPYSLSETFTVANWNLQIFGDKKANNSEILQYYANVIKNFDIVFLQEIRDKDGSAFQELCKKLDAYKCIVSSRAGRSSSKEQYGVVYLKDLNVSFFDYNPDIFDRWERPPIKISVFFNKTNYTISFYNIHTKPSNVSIELFYLEKLIDNTADVNSENIVVLGDLNADCYYYNASQKNAFLLGWYWLIGDSDDTTSTKSDCAYDRIIMNNDSYMEYISHGIEHTLYSDHYLIWARLLNKERRDKKFNDYVRHLQQLIYK
ncbi:MAG: hypothetical protein KatS3mg002_0628 [Candidatus Woesearchaeota archaeon]|nr:MAG: hypothetical protein KatS3mg002_0628 [Candidatus Woesearchaeota archaeon]